MGCLVNLLTNFDSYVRQCKPEKRKNIGIRRASNVAMVDEQRNLLAYLSSGPVATFIYAVCET